MVDRIVPATTEDDRDAVRRAIGLADATPVMHEPFRQWVIEDRFANGRPAWERVGAELVRDVAPFEHMKLRLLNGAHSALAYLGYLAGHRTIFEAVSDPALTAYLTALWAEITPMVPPPPGTDLHAYTDRLRQRFANPAIRHLTWQIAMDGSQKLPQRLLETARERLHAGLPIPALALAVAAWVRYAGGTDERNAPIDVRDPLADELSAAHDHDDPSARVRRILSVAAVFGPDLGADARFASAVTSAYCDLLRRGARAAAIAIG